MNKYEKFSKAKDRGDCLGGRGFKLKFATKELAELAIDHYPKNRRRKPARAYECPSCGQWHLTAKGSP